MSKTSKALYLPLSIATSVTGGLVAGAVFGQIWKRFSDQEPAPPDPKDLSNSSRAALLGAGLQGLIFGVVKAAVDRAGARGYEAVTHETAPQIDLPSEDAAPNARHSNRLGPLSNQTHR